MVGVHNDEGWLLFAGSARNALYTIVIILGDAGDRAQHKGDIRRLDVLRLQLLVCARGHDRQSGRRARVCACLGGVIELSNPFLENEKKKNKTKPTWVQTRRKKFIRRFFKNRTTDGSRPRDTRRPAERSGSHAVRVETRRGNG